MSVGDLFHSGWMEKNPNRIELYLTILNDLAEDVEVRGRLTRALLIETLGWMSAEQDRK